MSIKAEVVGRVVLWGYISIRDSRPLRCLVVLSIAWLSLMEALQLPAEHVQSVCAAVEKSLTSQVRSGTP